MQKTLTQFVVGTIGLFIVASSPVASAQDQAQSANGPSSTNEASGPGKTADQRSAVAYKDGRLSVIAKASILRDLANEIADKAKLPLLLDDAVLGQPISVDFRDLPLDQGLRRIFANMDAFFFYGVDKDGPSSLQVVWVYPKGKARGMAPVPAEKWASTKELEQMLTNADPEIRGRAIEAIVDRKRDQAGAAVAKALKDPDDQVRVRALYGASIAGVQLPAESLQNMALNDASADVRFLALQSLGNSADAKVIAQAALNDPSEPVRSAAQEILQRLADSDATGQPAPVRTEPPNN